MKEEKKRRETECHLVSIYVAQFRCLRLECSLVNVCESKEIPITFNYHHTRTNSISALNCDR